MEPYSYVLIDYKEKMKMKKPNQVIDEIAQVIYPPAEAVVNQLTTIRAIVTPTIKMYESTKDIHTIQPNLDMIQRAIDYLRGAPMRDKLKPAPDDKLDSLKFLTYTSGFNIAYSLNKQGEYDVAIYGTEITPTIEHKDLFGDPERQVVEIGLEIPVTCGKSYLIAQENPVLKEYATSDETVSEIDGAYIKEKIYPMDEDTLQYNFLLQEGRTSVRIAMYADYEEPIVFNISSHIHFKEQEEKDND